MRARAVSGSAMSSLDAITGIAPCARVLTGVASSPHVDRVPTMRARVLCGLLMRSRVLITGIVPCVFFSWLVCLSTLIASAFAALIFDVFFVILAFLFCCLSVSLRLIRSDRGTWLWWVCLRVNTD